MEELFMEFLRSFGIKENGKCARKKQQTLVDTYYKCLKQRSLKPINDFRKETESPHSYGDLILLLVLNNE